MFIDYLKVSFLMMRAKPVRAALSLLGIYIGVLALVIILAIREGIRHQIDDLYRTPGAHVIFVHPGFDQVRKKIGRMTRDDLERLKSARGILSVSARSTSEAEVRSPAAALRAHVVGVDEPFVSVYRVPVLRGRTFLGEEVLKKQPLCLLTVQAVRQLFPTSEPLGMTVDFQGVPHQVIGVVDWTAPVASRTTLQEVDMLVPAGRLSEPRGGFIASTEVRVDARLTPEQALRLVKDVLSRGDPSREAEYFVRSLYQSVERSREMNDRILQGLLWIAAISLLVGGIGIANVMVTTVTERTREVGIRKALGAKRTDILAQFLVESIVLTASGGGLAVLTGSLAVNVGPSLFEIATPLIVPVAPVIACFGLTLLIGLLAGVYPASRAASLSPAEALRYE